MCMYVYIYIYIDRSCGNWRDNRASLLTSLSSAPKGNGIGATGSKNQTRVLRTMPSRETQGF